MASDFPLASCVFSYASTSKFRASLCSILLTSLLFYHFLRSIAISENCSSSYNILNNLIPGAVFVFWGKLLDIISLPLDGIVECIFVYYFLGMIISRMGSLVIEEAFKKLKWIKYTPKAEYVAAVKKDARIESLLETSNMYRTCAGLFLTLGIVKVYSTLVGLLAIPKQVTIWLVVIVLFVLFSSSFVKQTKHIVSRVDTANKSKGDK